MKKNRKWCLPLVFSVLVAACTVDAYETTTKKLKEDDENKPLSETWSAIPENYHCLNVVYYVPADMDTLTLWHKRLSGMTLNTQKFFKENMQRNKYDKTFGLVVNDSNQHYIQMTCIKSKLESSKMKQENIQEMSDEVMAYFKENPDKKLSNHFLVYMPEYTGSFFDCIFLNPSGEEVPDHAMAFAGCDTEKFDPKFLQSARGRKAYLQKSGQVMYELMHAFFQTDNNASALLSRFSLTGCVDKSSGKLRGYSQYYVDLDKICLTPVDAMWLDRIQVFNEKGFEYSPLGEVSIEDVRFSWIDGEEYITERDSLVVECTFRSSDELIGAILYVDPWRTTDEAFHKNPNTRTGEDAMAYCKQMGEIQKISGDLYEMKFLVLWSDVNTNNTRNNTTDPTLVDDPETPLRETNQICKAEMRFRFIGKGGMAYPQPTVSLKGDWESNLRWYFQIRRYWNGVYYGADMIDLRAPDVVERYQVE